MLNILYPLPYLRRTGVRKKKEEKRKEIAELRSRCGTHTNFSTCSDSITISLFFTHSVYHQPHLFGVLIN